LVLDGPPQAGHICALVFHHPKEAAMQTNDLARSTAFAA